LFGAAFAVSALVAATGCLQPPGTDAEEPERVGVARGAITVAEAADTTCSTMSVRELSLQIIAQSNCIEPGAFSEIPELPNVTMGDTVFPYLEEPAKDAFVNAANANPGMQLTVNSMLRTVAQQLLLYRWDQMGTCNIMIAAYPGDSNHETGLAFDTSQYNAWRPAMEAEGFAWYGSGDPVHFDYAGPGAINYKGTDVLAFQMLWNQNHPDDPIDEDGVYGPQTEGKLLASPADGFPRPVTCGPSPSERADIYLAVDFVDAADDFADGPSAGVTDLFETEAVTWIARVENHGGPATDVVLGIDLGAGDFAATAYSIEHAATAEGPFEPDPANGASTNPSHDTALGDRFELRLGAFAALEHKRVAITVEPLRYSVDGLELPTARAWIAQVDELYTQAEFGGEVTNVDDSQTFGAGRLELAQTVDVYSRTHWEWESSRLEGASGSAGVVFSSIDGALQMKGGESSANVATPVVDLSGAAGAHVTLRASRAGGTGEAILWIARESSELDQVEALLIDLPDDGSMHEVVLDIGPGSIKRVAFVPFDGSAGEASLDYLRIQGVEIPGEGGAGADDGSDDPDDGPAACTGAPRHGPGADLPHRGRPIRSKSGPSAPHCHDRAKQALARPRRVNHLFWLSCLPLGQRLRPFPSRSSRSSIIFAFRRPCSTTEGSSSTRTGCGAASAGAACWPAAYSGVVWSISRAVRWRAAATTSGWSPRSRKRSRPSPAGAQTSSP